MNKSNMLSWVLVLTIVGIAYYTDRATTNKRKAETEMNIIKPPEKGVKSGSTLINVEPILKGYNYRENKWVYYTDQEIRTMREAQSYKSDGKYIYTPGRHIPTVEDKIEEYIDDNIEEIMDKYGY